MTQQRCRREKWANESHRRLSEHRAGLSQQSVLHHADTRATMTSITVTKRRFWSSRAPDAPPDGSIGDLLTVACALRNFRHLALAASIPTEDLRDSLNFVYISFQHRLLQNLAFRVEVLPDDEIAAMYNPSKYKQGQEIPIPELEVSPTLFALLAPPQPVIVTKTPLKMVQTRCDIQIASIIPLWKQVKVEFSDEVSSFDRLPSLEFVRARLDGLAFANGSRIPVKFGTGEIIQITLYCGEGEANQRGIVGTSTFLQYLDTSSPSVTLASSSGFNERDPNAFYVSEAEQLEYMLKQSLAMRQHRPALVFLLHGASGTGKTHLVKQLGHDMRFQVVPVTSSEILDAKVTNPFERLLRKFLRLRTSDGAEGLDNAEEKERASKNVILLFDDVEVLLTSDEISDLESQRKCKIQFAAMIELLHHLFSSSSNTVVIIGCTNAVSSMDINTRRLFEREILLEPPSKNARVSCMMSLLQAYSPDPPLLASATEIFESCHGYSISDMENLIRTAAVLAELRSAEISDNDDGEGDNDGSLGVSDSDSETVEMEPTRMGESQEQGLNQSLSELVLGTLQQQEPSRLDSHRHQRYAMCGITLEDLKEAKKSTKPESLKTDLQFVPSSALAHFDAKQMAGLETQYAQLVQSTVWMYKYKEQFNRMGIEATRGTLLFGPPGTGKTMLAKAVASESQANFLAISISDLIKGEIGASEEAIASLFRKARSLSPCIIFLDEVQAMFGSRDSSGAHGKNMISQLLLEMDGLAQAQDVAVIAATNRPDWIDAGLLRPGRFDRCLYIPPPNAIAREHILRYSLAKIRSDSVITSDEFIKSLALQTENFTGADLTNLCMKAAWNTIKQSTNSANSTSPEDVVTKEHIRAALQGFSPTVTKQMTSLYASFQNMYGRAELQERAHTNAIPTSEAPKPSATGQPPLSRSEQFRLEREAQIKARRR